MIVPRQVCVEWPCNDMLWGQKHLMSRICFQYPYYLVGDSLAFHITFIPLARFTFCEVGQLDTGASLPLSRYRDDIV